MASISARAWSSVTPVRSRPITHIPRTSRSVRVAADSSIGSQKSSEPPNIVMGASTPTIS